MDPSCKIGDQPQMTISVQAELPTGMRIRIRSDPLIFGPPDPDPVLFSLDPDPAPSLILYQKIIDFFL